MNKIQWLRQRIREFRSLSEQIGGSPLPLLLSYEIGKYRLGTSINQFYDLRLYDYSFRKQSEFLTLERQEKLIQRYFNAGAQKEDYNIFDNKHCFLKTFRDFIRRDWLYTPESTPDDIRVFIEKHPVFVLKTDTGTMGQGVSLCRRDELDIDRFLAEHQNNPFVLEAYIQQHPSMKALNPTSINTVRAVTAHYKGHVMIVGAGLRCGGTGSHLDNFHSGGVAYPVDIDSGIVTGVGRREADRASFLRHPPTGHIMPGFQIPNWDILTEQIRKAATSYAPSISRVGYVGWDVAVTPDGIDLVEGNTSPMCALIQLDGNGVYKKLTDFIASADKTEPLSNQMK